MPLPSCPYCLLEVKHSFPHFPWSFPPPSSTLTLRQTSDFSRRPCFDHILVFVCPLCVAIWVLLLQHQTTSSPIFPSEGLLEMSGLLEDPHPHHCGQHPDIAGFHRIQGHFPRGETALDGEMVWNCKAAFVDFLDNWRRFDG